MTRRLPFSPSPSLPFSFVLRLCVSAVIVLAAIACGTKPTDPRTVIPGDALMYLETNDLGKTLAAIVNNPKFEQLAKTKPNLSPLNGVKVSVAVTGFQTSEQTVTDENAVLDFQPRLVAVAETNAWGWQTASFIEDQLGEFVNSIYEPEVVMESVPRGDGKFYVWKVEDVPKAYAFQQGSLVFFGNDESAIERCQAVRRGEIEPISSNAKITDVERLAFGYVSPEGVGQIANIAGIWLAIGVSEEEEVKSFVAGVLPEILRNSVKEVSWTATSSEQGIEDKVLIALDDESARVYSAGIAPAQGGAEQLTELIPSTAVTSTRYRIRDPQIAWRSLVLTAQKKTDVASGALIGAFSSSFFEPYGVEDPEIFLSAVGSQLVTVRTGGDSEDAVVITTIKDSAKIRDGIAKEISFARPAEKIAGAEVWKSQDGEIAVAFLGDRIIAGDTETVLKCLEARQAGGNQDIARQFAASDAVAVTAGNDTDPAAKLIEILSERKNENEPLTTQFRIETRFNQNGIERRRISDFGFFGWIIEHLAQG